jgi:membrane protein DedA with SNARE-associated domain
MATLGSLAGCFVLYWLAWKGGEAVARRWFHERHIEKGMATFQRYGVLALLVPSILPPPAPFKIFVLLGDGECNEGSVWEAVISHQRCSSAI